MRFLVDASLPRAVASLARSLGHAAADVRDIGFGSATDGRIAEHARQHALTILTADFDFADIRVFPPSEYAGIIVIDRPPNATVDQVLELVRGPLQDQTLLAQLPRRLAIVDPARTRIRPALPETP